VSRREHGRKRCCRLRAVRARRVQSRARIGHVRCVRAVDLQRGAGSCAVRLVRARQVVDCNTSCLGRGLQLPPRVHGRKRRSDVRSMRPGPAQDGVGQRHV